jgi:hypothetical protein
MNIPPSTPVAAGEATQHIQVILKDMYAAFQEADWARFNAHLDPSLTAWETHLPHMLRGQSDLDAYRAARGAPQKLAYLEARELLVDTWESTALARYLLVGASAADTTNIRRSRVTEILRWDGTTWKIVHRHSERLTA